MAQINNYEWIDSVPRGWHELARKMIEECEAIYPDWKIVDLKEKFGAIRCYDNGSPKEVQEIIDKYEAISARTCCNCGKPATRISTGWILPWCDNCGDGDEAHYRRFNK